MTKSAEVSIIGGAGHIGLPLAVKFAEKEIKVNILDTNKINLLKIQNNKPPFKEKDLNKKLKNVLKKKKDYFFQVI